MSEHAPAPRTMALGGALRRAWVGYQHLLDDELAAAGFDRGLPDGRVLRICARSPEATISAIGRELGITRQGAAKLAGSLRDHGYVTLDPSPDSGREKRITLTPRAREYLTAHRDAARSIEQRLRVQLGEDAYSGLFLLLEALGQDDQPRMRDYIHRATRAIDDATD
ncbi:MAG: MarR family winged helix-turn-helix transcriptional regulator [Trebonia sp.]